MIVWEIVQNIRKDEFDWHAQQYNRSDKASNNK